MRTALNPSSPTSRSCDDGPDQITGAVAVWIDPERTRAFYKGRVALYAILRAAGVGPGDQVVLPGFTCVVVPAAVRYAGAEPVYYDIAPRTLNGDPQLAAERIGPRTRAVIVQHTFGEPMDLGDLPRLCRERGIVLVEDCAHAVGSRHDGVPVGTLGDAAFCSLQWSKPTTIGLGGIARVNDTEFGRRLDEEIAAHYRAPSLRQCLALDLMASTYARLVTPANYWRLQSLYRWAGRHGLVQGSSGPRELFENDMPHDYRRLLGDSRRRHLERALAKLPAIIVHRRELAALYRTLFAAGGWPVAREDERNFSIHLRYPLLVENRDELLKKARAAGVQLGDWFNAPLHPAASNAVAFGYRPGLCPHADRVTSQLINTPTGPHVSREKAEATAAFVLASGIPASWTAG
jgi:perosamine synthetase